MASLQKKPPSGGRPRRNRRRTPNTYVTRRSANGGKMSMPDNPPDVISQPWNQLTLVFALGAEKVTVGNLHDRLIEQIDPNTTFVAPITMWNNPTETGTAWRNVAGTKPSTFTVNVVPPQFAMKIHSIRVWNLTGRAVSLTAYDYSNTSTGSETLIGVVDTGGINRFPAVGYSLPMSLRNYILRTTDIATAKANVFETTTGDGDRCISYVRVEWRCDGASRVPTFVLAPSEKIHKDVSKTTKSITKLVEMQETANTGIKSLVDAQPSTVKRIFDGVLETASIVLPLAAASETLEHQESAIPSLLEKIKSLEERLNNVELHSSYSEIGAETDGEA